MQRISLIQNNSLVILRNQSQQTGDTVEQVRSQVGSLEGNVHVQAGGTYIQRAADVLANKDIDIQAKHIDVQAAYNTGTQTQSEKDTKIGTFASVSSPIFRCDWCGGQCLKQQSG